MLTNPGIYAPAWMRDTPLEQVWINAYIETGDAQMAMEMVRQNRAYDDYLPGNRREDGSLRYDETTYFGLVESYEDAILSVGLNPDIFRGRFQENIEGLTSPQEFASRINAIYENIILAIPETAEWAAREFNIDATPQALIAMAIDPDVGTALLERRIAMSEVGASAASRNFTIGGDLAERMVQYGVGTFEEAQEYFGEAQSLIPTLNVLAARHADPDDDFDLGEFTNATLFGDPDQRRRMRRMLAQERASFGPDVGLGVRRDDAGSLTGLSDF